MMDNNFEAAFSEFLDRHEYDDAESALFAIVRAAFLAGQRAARGRRRNGCFGFFGGPENNFRNQ